MQAVMKCTKKDGQMVRFEATYSDDKGQAILQSFSAATPYAAFDMAITNPAALEQCEPGEFYQVDFTRLAKEAVPLK